MAEKGYDMNTILGENSTYEGKLNVKGSMRIEGAFSGEISADSVVIGKKAVVKANIVAMTVIVGGVVEGNIKSHKHLTVQTTGKVIGDIEVERLVVEDGAILQGKCTMKVK